MKIKKPAKRFKLKTIRKDGLENCFCTWILESNEIRGALKAVHSPWGLMCGEAPTDIRGAATLCRLHAIKYDYPNANQE